MDIGLMTDSVAALTTRETLDLAADLGLDTVEFAPTSSSTTPRPCCACARRSAPSSAPTWTPAI